MDMSRYLDLFLSESREHLGAAHEVHSSLEHDPLQADLWNAFMRHAHSLKGMAASMRFSSMVVLTHAAEDLAQRLESAQAAESRAYLPLLGESLACLGSLLDRIESGADASCARAEELARLLQGRELPIATAAAEPAVRPVDPQPAPSESTHYWQVDLRLGSDAAESAHRTVSTLERVGQLGQVVQSGPPSLALGSARFSGRLRLVLQTERDRDELAHELSAIVGAEEFELAPAARPTTASDDRNDPAGWIRVRSDVIENVVEALLEMRQQQGRLRASLPATDRRARHHLQRGDFLLKELYGEVMELHLVPFETVAQRMHQTVVELARELDKSLRFEIVGGQVRVDRLVLEALNDPVVQALRNAVDHGLEPVAERRKKNKPAQGHLRLMLTRSGERVSIVVSDDGRGMRPELLRKSAVERGVINAEDAADLTDEEALLLATFPRLSTRSAPDHISGRGVGLDIVRERVESIGGFVEIRSEPGRGCELRMSVPLRRALIQTLLVRCAGELFAIPLDAVVKTVDLDQLETAPDGGRGPVRLKLAQRLGLRSSDEVQRARPRALLLDAAERPTALVVDEVIGRQDLVAQPLHPPLAQLREYSGAALLEDGTIVPIVDPSYLLRA
jgi:two-component system chemotaxis sensor kinase CheA